jgi:hypothetical protein
MVAEKEVVYYPLGVPFYIYITLLYDYGDACSPRNSFRLAYSQWLYASACHVHFPPRLRLRAFYSWTPLRSVWERKSAPMLKRLLLNLQHSMWLLEDAISIASLQIPGRDGWICASGRMLTAPLLLILGLTN